MAAAVAVKNMKYIKLLHPTTQNAIPRHLDGSGRQCLVLYARRPCACLLASTLSCRRFRPLHHRCTSTSSTKTIGLQSFTEKEPETKAAKRAPLAPHIRIDKKYRIRFFKI